MKRIIQTGADNWAGLVARLSIAIMVFPHGAQKLLGWFGGGGYDASMIYFTQSLGIPAIIAILVFLFEFIGSLFLFAGLFTRIATLAIALNFFGVIGIDIIHNGWFMNWGRQGGQGEGLEFFVLLFGLVIISLIYGGGKASIDSALFNRNKTESEVLHK